MKKDIPRFFTWPFDPDMAVVDTVRRELRIINGTAANIWRLLEAGGFSSEEIASLLSEHYDVALPVTRRDVANCLAVWQALGWIDDVNRPVLLKIGQDVPPFGMLSMPRTGEAPPDHCVETHRFLVGDGHPVSLHLSADGRPAFRNLANRLIHVLSGLSSPVPYQIAATLPPDGLALLDGGDRYWLRGNGTWLWTNDPAEVIARVQMQLLAAGYADLPYLVTMHAGVAGRPTGCLVMPGISGAGKSTLTGWLTSRGWYYGGDDMVGLMAEGAPSALWALPFPTALSAKTGSWPVLGPLFPALMDRQGAPGPDRDTRYLPIATDRHLPWHGDARRVRAMVLPHYHAGAGADLQPITLQETMQMLADSGLTTGDHLDSALLNRFFTLLDGLPKYRLTYGDLGMAQAVLEPLLPEAGV